MYCSAIQNSGTNEEDRFKIQESKKIITSLASFGEAHVVKLMYLKRSYHARVDRKLKSMNLEERGQAKNRQEIDIDELRRARASH